MGFEIELSPEQIQEIADRKEHQEAIESVRAILSTNAGKRFIKYLFQSFDVGEFPEKGLSGEYLHDTLGFLRAGQSIFKLVAEVDPAQAGLILGQIEREKYEKKLREILR